MTKRIGALIRHLRQERGLTQRSFAERSGMNHTYVSKIENGRLETTPSAETLVTMADVLEVDRDWLLTQCGRPPQGLEAAIAECPEFFAQFGKVDARDLMAPASRFRLLGHIAAGEPIEAVEDTETFDLTDMFAPGEHYLLKVRGDSMIEDAILDGDIAIVRPQKTCENGEIVVAIVDGDEATLKRFFREGDHIRLQPANALMKPILVHPAEIEIRGKVVGIIRTRLLDN